MIEKGKIMLQAGSVVEFKLPEYFVYGVVLELHPNRGDCIALVADRFISPIMASAELYGRPFRCKIQFFAKFAEEKRYRDVLRLWPAADLGKVPDIDSRFRLLIPGGVSTSAKWQITDGASRVPTKVLTKELALLSDAGVPNLDYIRNYFDNDFYPWSAELVSRGPIDFDPYEFERQQRAIMSARLC